MEITTSENINEISAALAKAQGSMAGAKADSVNPHFKSKYADLASAWDAARDALSKNCIAVVQIPEANGATVSVTTILTHSSGQYMRGCLTMIAQKNTPQGIGSCITYARRYSLMAFVGLAPEDDDGNEAEKPAPGQKAPRQVLSEPQIQRLYALQSQSSITVADLKAKMKKNFGIDSSKELSREQYEIVCKALIDNPKPKPEPQNLEDSEPKSIEDLKSEGSVKSGAEV